MACEGLLGLAMFAAAASGASSPRDEGIAAFHQGRYSVALDRLTQAVRADPADPQGRVFLALAQAARNDCKAALPALTSFARSAGDTLARLAGLAAAKCQESAGDHVAALAALRDLEKRFPNDADVLYTMAKLHMKAFSDTSFAMFQRVPASYRVHQLSAEIFEAQGRYGEAVSEYRKAIALNPAAPNLHFRLGRALLLAGHEEAALEQARAEFAAELKLSPEDAACEFQLGQISQVQGKGEEASSHFRAALALAPDFPEALVALGRLESQAQRYSEAIAFLERAVALQPANEAAHYALMLAYRNTGQTEKARAEKDTLDRLQKTPEGEFTEFLKKLGEKPPKQ